MHTLSERADTLCPHIKQQSPLMIALYSVNYPLAAIWRHHGEEQRKMFIAGDLVKIASIRIDSRDSVGLVVTVGGKSDALTIRKPRHLQ